MPETTVVEAEPKVKIVRKNIWYMMCPGFSTFLMGLKSALLIFLSRGIFVCISVEN